MTIEEMLEDIQNIKGIDDIEVINKRLNHIYQLLYDMIGENDNHMLELINQIKKNTDSLISFHY